MTDKEPTQEQLEEFWERCGWHTEVATLEDGTQYPVLLSPDEELVKEYRGYIPEHLPNLDLNNLFKYAVPRLFAYELHTIWQSIDAVSELSVAEVWLNSERSQKAKHKDPTLALFWAVWAIIKT